MIRTLLSLCGLLLLSGCINSYEEEYRAALKELEATQQALAEAQQKLKAADNEIRHKVFTLARRINTYVQAEQLDLPALEQMSQEMTVHRDSHDQMGDAADLTGVVARFYKDKVDRVIGLRRDSLSAYDRQYTACLSDLDAKGGKNQLGTMLCEVQADVAKHDLEMRQQATVRALLKVGEALLKSRSERGPAASDTEVERRFQSAYTLTLNELQAS